MYLRKVTSKRKHGPDAVYLQLVEGVRDQKTGKVVTRILHSFGRVDRLDTRQIERLVNQLAEYLDAEDRPTLYGDMEVAHTWGYGGTYLLDVLWRELELDQFFEERLSRRLFEQPLERVLFTLVAQRALAPGSKLACERWAGHRVWIPGLDDGGESLSSQHFYRAMDYLFEEMPELREHLYFQVTDLLNADVSILFYDTTSVSFHIDDEDKPHQGPRRFGHSKKKRPDMPQVVVALAINRDGIPVRHWVFPGNRSDKTTVEEVTSDLQGLRPRRYLFVGDRGMVSQDNIDYLESRRLPYLFGCRMRSDRVVDERVLSIRGRYRTVDDDLGVKETTVTEGGREIRYLLCHSESRAGRDAAVRARTLSRLEEKLEGSAARDRHTRKSCDLLTKPGYRRYLRELKGGGLRIDRRRVREEERLDGKYVLMTNELDVPAEELVRGYRDLWLIERAFRSMKSLLDIEPVFHRTVERITSHVHLCVLAYLLMRIAENRTDTSWELIREQLSMISLNALETKRSTALKTKRLTGKEKSLMKKCRVPEPPQIVDIT